MKLDEKAKKKVLDTFNVLLFSFPPQCTSSELADIQISISLNNGCVYLNFSSGWFV